MIEFKKRRQILRVHRHLNNEGVSWIVLSDLNEDLSYQLNNGIKLSVFNLIWRINEKT